MTDVATPLMISKWATRTRKRLLWRLMAGDNLGLDTHLSPVKLTDCFCLKRQAERRTLSDPITPAMSEGNNVVSGGGMLAKPKGQGKIGCFWTNTFCFLIGVHACNPAGVHGCKNAANLVTQRWKGKTLQLNVAGRSLRLVTVQRCYGNHRNSAFKLPILFNL